MSPACWVSPDGGAWPVRVTLAWVSPVTGSDTRRNWSPVPLTPVPAAFTVRVPAVDDSLPLAGLWMSWQVKPVGQLGSAGGVAGAGPSPKA